MACIEEVHRIRGDNISDNDSNIQQQQTTTNLKTTSITFMHLTNAPYQWMSITRSTPNAQNSRNITPRDLHITHHTTHEQNKLGSFREHKNSLNNRPLTCHINTSMDRCNDCFCWLHLVADQVPFKTTTTRSHQTSHHHITVQNFEQNSCGYNDSSSGLLSYETAILMRH